MRSRAVLATFLLAVLLAACAGAGISPVLPSSATGGDGKEGEVVPQPSGASGDGSALVVTASLALEVDDLDAAIAAARTAVTARGGVLTGLSRGSEGWPVYREDGSLVGMTDTPAHLEFRVPAAALDAAVADLKGLGDVASERTTAADVSATLRDVGARLDNLRAAERNYVRLLDRAETVTDLLAVQAQLDQVRGQIEQLAAEQAALRDQVARSALSVTLYPPATPIDDATRGFDPTAIAADAAALLVGLGRLAAAGLIYAVIVGLPLLVALLAAWAVVRRVRRRGRPSAGAGG